MSFKTKIEQQLKSAVYGSVEKNVLKVLLGEIQNEGGRRVNAGRDVSDEVCIKFTKKLIKDNEETLGFLRKAGAAAECEKLEEENLVLEALLPDENSLYWSKQDIRNWISDEKINVSSFPSVGQAVGKCMSQLKGMDVRGDDVRQVVEELMSQH